jgi:hypothetical protein
MASAARKERRRLERKQRKAQRKADRGSNAVSAVARRIRAKWPPRIPLDLQPLGAEPAPANTTQDTRPVTDPREEITRSDRLNIGHYENVVRVAIDDLIVQKQDEHGIHAVFGAAAILEWAEDPPPTMAEKLGLYVADVRAGDEFPPILLREFEHDDRVFYEVEDGRHRVFAYALAGRSHIDGQVLFCNPNGSALIELVKQRQRPLARSQHESRETNAAEEPQEQ